MRKASLSKQTSSKTPIQPNLYRKHLDRIGERLGIKTQEDWYSISGESVRRVGGKSLLQRYSGSLRNLLKSVYPEFTWNAFQLHKAPQQYWRSLDNKRQLYDWIGEQLGVERQEDWYAFTTSHVKECAGYILDEFNGSMLKALQSVYPEFEWNPFQLQKAPRHYWDNPKNYRNLFDWISEQIGIQQQSDWYSVTLEQINQFLNPSVSLHKGSLRKTLQKVYPEFEWPPLFHHMANFYWKYRDNQRSFFDWLSEQLGITTYEDWFSITLEDLIPLGAHHALSDFDYSVVRGLKSAYPEFEWTFWNSPLHLRKFFDGLAEKLQMTQQKDFYDLTWDDVHTNGGSEVLASLFSESHNTSVIEVLSTVYPEFTWFTLKDFDNQRLFLEELGDQLGVAHTTEWISISRLSVLRSGGLQSKQLLNIHGSWIQTLRNLFPHFNWPEGLHSSFGQSSVVQLLSSILRGYKLRVNHRLGTSGLELDLYFPQLSLAFEYQGGHHYFSEQRRNADLRKVEICKERGITLIEVPYWWDNTASSLVSRINHYRPDLQLTYPRSVKSVVMENELESDT